MEAHTRYWPEVLSVKLAIFEALKIWEMAEIVAMQLTDSARGNPRWLAIAESARREIRAARQRPRHSITPDSSPRLLA